MSSSLPSLRGTLVQHTSAPEYILRVSEAVKDMQAARDRLGAVELLRKATLCLGADVSIFASVTRWDSAPHCYRLLLACDPCWCTEYDEYDGYANDPWLNYALRHTEPARASEIQLTTPMERALVALAERYGFNSSVIIPIRSGGGGWPRGALCLGASVPGYFDGEGYLPLKVVARSVAMELHEWWLARLKDQLIALSGITATDIELLRYEARGLSTKEIAREFGATVSSIDSRFQRINLRLGTPNRKASAKLAGEHGLVE